MKILLLSTSERTGGAAIATNRLMHALNKSGQEAKMLVRDKQTDDPNVVSINTNRWKKTINFIRFAYEQWVIFVHNRFDRKNLFAVSIANTGTDISNHSLVKEADVIHLHWINQGFLSLENIRQLQMLNKPVVWTMHDMWVCSGICHYVASTAYPHIDAVRCNRFVLQCDICPFTPSGLAFQTWRKKKTVFMPQKILFVGCSNWISNMAKSSALLRDFGITNIPNPVDIDVFKPSDSTAVRNKFNLPLNRKLILFAAANLSDKRKGIDYFIESCRMLAQAKEQPAILLMGGRIDGRLLTAIPLSVYVLGYLHTTEDICMAYTAADVYVTPSLSENLPNTVMEAMACGTPCVGFNTGGIPEMIDHKQNGYVAEYKNAKDLAAGIEWVLENTEKSGLADACVKKVKENYSETVVVGKYLSLYGNCNKIKNS